MDLKKDGVLGDKVNRSAAWYYRDPKPAAAEIRGRIAFRRGVRIEPAPVPEPTIA